MNTKQLKEELKISQEIIQKEQEKQRRINQQLNTISLPKTPTAFETAKKIKKEELTRKYHIISIAHVANPFEKDDANKIMALVYYQELKKKSNLLPLMEFRQRILNNFKSSRETFIALLKEYELMEWEWEWHQNNHK